MWEVGRTVSAEVTTISLGNEKNNLQHKEGESCWRLVMAMPSKIVEVEYSNDNVLINTENM